MPDPSLPGSTETQRPRQATLGEVIRAVFWSFLGVRKSKDMQADAVSIRPHQVIIVGVALAAAFVGVLIVIVRLILRAAGA